MNFFVELMQKVAELPDLVSLILCPGLLVLAGLLLAIFHARKAYFPLSVGLIGAGMFLVSCESGSALVTLGYGGLFCALAALLVLLFCIPFPTGKGKDRSEELYEKFRLPLDEPTESECGEEERFGAEEIGLRLAHANDLVEKLKKCELSASDRLEVDSISNTLSGYSERDLTAEELRALNDCLATILKFTAKYSL